MRDKGASASLRILLLEDEPKDALLARAALEADGLLGDLECVSSRGEFTAALERGGIDVILSDFSLPGFDGLSALALAREMTPEVPFIFVSGTIGEDAAISAVRSGARDYVLKHRLSRLGPAVRRAVQEAEELKKRREAEATLRRTEDQLRQSQKMDAIGRLAGGVAHDFNNMLTAIMGFCQLLRMRTSNQDPDHQELDEIERAAARAASLTRQLLTLSRQQVLEPRVLDLNAAIAEADKLLRRLIGADVALRAIPGENLGAIKADPGQIDQIILNLAVNARDAMPNGGTLTIETVNVELDEQYARGHAQVRPGRYVMLAVSDTGCGMDDETKARIFEPFFTTKEVGKGTGLGLSTVYGIVKQSDGHIEVDSDPGRGSTFKVYLPRTERRGLGTTVSLSTARTPRGSETILLVDDEEQVRAIMRQSLEMNGYAVIEAADGRQALSRYGAHPGAIDLLITDIVLPHLGGLELAEHLVSVDPSMVVLYISGHTDKAIPEHAIDGPGRAFLQKPFTPQGLLRKVRETLDQPPAQVA